MIEFRLQKLPNLIFDGVVGQGEFYHITMCNPPFHASLADAQEGTQRKWRGLGKRNSNSRLKDKSTILNFGGQSNELYCEGGEEVFIVEMINESKVFSKQCLWFTTIISKASTLPAIYRALKKVNALQVKTIEMKQGQKKSRIVAWSFIQ